MRKEAVWSFDTVTGFLSTSQRTFSLHGGVELRLGQIARFAGFARQLVPIGFERLAFLAAIEQHSDHRQIAIGAFVHQMCDQIELLAVDLCVNRICFKWLATSACCGLRQQMRHAGDKKARHYRAL